MNVATIRQAQSNNALKIYISSENLLNNYGYIKKNTDTSIIHHGINFDHTVYFNHQPIGPNVSVLLPNINVNTTISLNTHHMKVYGHDDVRNRDINSHIVVLVLNFPVLTKTATINVVDTLPWKAIIPVAR